MYETANLFTLYKVGVFIKGNVTLCALPKGGTENITKMNTKNVAHFIVDNFLFPFGC
jgi:hypothetical protein